MTKGKKRRGKKFLCKKKQHDFHHSLPEYARADSGALVQRVGKMFLLTINRSDCDSVFSTVIYFFSILKNNLLIDKEYVK